MVRHLRTGVCVQGCRAANVWLRRRVIGNRGQAVARKCSNGLQQRRCRPLAHKNLLDGGRYVNVRHCQELPRPGQVDQGVGREGVGFSGEGYNNNLIVLQELEALSPPRWLKCCKVCSVCTNAAGSTGAVWRRVVRPRCQSGANKARASQAANAAGWRRPTAACSKGTKSQLCVRPYAGASGGPWLHQAAAAGTAVASGAKRRMCAAASGASTVGRRWPVQGRTSGGDPRQHTHQRLESRKSSASRRGPCAGTPAVLARAAATDGVHRR